MSKIFLVSDTHFNHNKLIEYCDRPVNFEDRILKGLKILCEDDILIHLGDFCIGKDDKWHREYLKCSNAKKNILVRGNHDSKSDSWYYERGWDFICKTFTAKYFGKKILFSHIPKMRLTHGNYDINIHGHFHNANHRRRELKLRLLKNKRQKLLALEHTNYQPVLLETFLGL